MSEQRIDPYTRNHRDLTGFQDRLDELSNAIDWMIEGPSWDRLHALCGDLIQLKEGLTGFDKAINRLAEEYPEVPS